MANARNISIAAGLAISAAAAPAQALPAPPADRSFAKAQAILGGESQLASILLQQEAARTEPLRPASYSFPRKNLTLEGTSARRVASEFSAERPDVFGTVALKVNDTSLDGRWRRVERSRIAGSAARYARSLQRADEQSRIELINRYVNRQVQFIDDSRQFGQADVWSTANETLRRGRGDCEDYAVAKLQMLRTAGIADSDLYLVILKDLVRRSDHAVVVVRSGRQMLVLDNGTDAVLESEEISDYRPVLTFAAAGTWTHGYRVTQAPVEMASSSPVEAGSAPIPASFGVDQRSRSASLRAFKTGFSK